MITKTNMSILMADEFIYTLNVNLIQHLETINYKFADKLRQIAILYYAHKIQAYSSRSLASIPTRDINTIYYLSITKPSPSFQIKILAPLNPKFSQAVFT